MPTKRPAAVLVMAILNLVFGGLGLALYLCATCAGVFLAVMFSQAAAAGNNPDVQELREMLASLERHFPWMVPGLVGYVAFQLVMFTLLLVAGLGLLKMRPWARVASLFYAGVTILEQIGFLIFRLAYMQRAMEEWQQEFQQQMLARHPGARPAPGPFPGGPFAGGPMVEGVGAALSALLGMAYPVALLIVLLLPHVSAAFAARRMADYDDRERKAEDEMEEDHYDRGERWGDEPRADT
jgi:hypothetical protein